ncbi:hypothetical protein HDV05_003169 [Chytridiales sp. JEL 0842]|nr:hypothetical protein HDV05_003169 [Chytridiales sp. JEL 0842]
MSRKQLKQQQQQQQQSQNNAATSSTGNNSRPTSPFWSPTSNKSIPISQLPTPPDSLSPTLSPSPSIPSNSAKPPAAPSPGYNIKRACQPSDKRHPPTAISKSYTVERDELGLVEYTLKPSTSSPPRMGACTLCDPDTWTFNGSQYDPFLSLLYAERDGCIPSSVVTTYPKFIVPWRYKNRRTQEISWKIFHLSGDKITSADSETIVVNPAKDFRLQNVMRRAAAAKPRFRLPYQDVELVEHLLQIVRETLGEYGLPGGPSSADADARLYQQMLRQGHNFMLLCDVEIGLCRHKALLFKILCDVVALNCALVTGYSTAGRHQWNIITLPRRKFASAWSIWVKVQRIDSNTKQRLKQRMTTNNDQEPLDDPGGPGSADASRTLPPSSPSHASSGVPLGVSDTERSPMDIPSKTRSPDSQVRGTQSSTVSPTKAKAASYGSTPASMNKQQPDSSAVSVLPSPPRGPRSPERPPIDRSAQQHPSSTHGLTPHPTHSKPPPLPLAPSKPPISTIPSDPTSTSKYNLLLDPTHFNPSLQSTLPHPHLHPFHPRNRPLPPPRPIPQQPHQRAPAPAGGGAVDPNFRHPFTYQERAYMNLRLYTVLASRSFTDPLESIQSWLYTLLAWIVCLLAGLVVAGAAVLGKVEGLVKRPYRQPPLISAVKADDGSEYVLTVVIPTLNNASSIVETILHVLRNSSTDAVEVIVCDGGSEDGTMDCVKRLSLGSEKGRIKVLEMKGVHRAARMNAGGVEARGGALLFLLPETLLPVAYDTLILRTIYNDAVTSTRLNTAGTFRLSTTLHTTPTDYDADDLQPNTPSLLPLLQLYNSASALLNTPLHPSQTIFLARSTFLLSGGFPNQPILEFQELTKSWKRNGGILKIAEGDGVRLTVVHRGSLVWKGWEEPKRKLLEGSESEEQVNFDTDEEEFGRLYGRSNERGVGEGYPWSAGTPAGELGFLVVRTTLAMMYVLLMYSYLGMSARGVYETVHGLPPPPGTTLDAKEEALLLQRRKQQKHHNIRKLSLPSSSSSSSIAADLPSKRSSHSSKSSTSISRRPSTISLPEAGRSSTHLSSASSKSVLPSSASSVRRRLTGLHRHPHHESLRTATSFTVSHCSTSYLSSGDTSALSESGIVSGVSSPTGVEWDEEGESYAGGHSYAMAWRMGSEGGRGGGGSAGSSSFYGGGDFGRARKSMS